MKSTGRLTGAPARVARALLEGGPQTAAALAERLDLSTTAVRRHLDALVEDGLAESGERAPYGPAAATDRPRGAGRPAKVFTLTAAGRDAFEQQYDDLAVQALRYLADTAGQDAVDDFARRRVAVLEDRFGATVGSACPEERPALLVEALNDEGYAASLVDSPGGPAVQLCQHHCPVSHVAAEFPVLCEAETEAFSRLLGIHVTRLATLAHGDGVCTTLVPRPATARQEVSP
ncbi:MAG TPA: metalloregulator ArsR/SmtB family transcription factor [Candidatus Nanopelagicales bacterium]|nr:metalloregulator ArsR/SmtB family transcription factor [Candidatus Nanopelagicales bacterium]